jgi:hypothetical protein
MIKKFISQYKFLTLILLVVGCSPTRGCVESHFVMADDSPLPVWFAPATPFQRDKWSVEVTYYTTTEAHFELFHEGVLVDELTANTHYQHPETVKKHNEVGGFNPGKSYPHYWIVEARGEELIIEHVRGPTFRFVDAADIEKTPADFDPGPTPSPWDI